MVFSLIAVCLLTSAKSPCAAEPLSSVIPSEPITFDVPGIAIAKPIHAKPNQYSIKLAVSAMVHPDQEVFSKHWRLVVQPRDQRIRIVDYSPKTETTSALVGGVETKTTQEESRSIGLGATLSYSNFARAQSNTDRTSQESNSFTFQSKAVQQPRIASGTLDRGRGVHFKLARTSEQILDGEKEFEILPSGASNGTRPRAFGNNVGSNPNNVFDGTTDLLPTFNQLIAQNSGKPYYNSEVTMQSAGFVYKGERWLINAQLAQRTEEAATAQEEAWKDVLSWETYEGDGEGGDDDILPILNAVRLLGAEKQGYAGFGFGSFGQSFGFGLSAGWRFFEKLEIGAFGGMALDVTGADEIEAEGYESVEGDTYASFGINYLF